MVPPAVPTSLSGLSPLILGGAVFNTQYNPDPELMPVAALVRHAFANGINAIDTLPYYGSSEELLGKALAAVADEYPRSLYYICTKAGRVRLDEFDYSPAAIRALVLRSLQRLNTSYLDLVYAHDCEFVSYSQAMEALRELALLKKEGLIRHFGFSGYPLPHLVEIAKRCAEDPLVGPADAVLLYLNGCLQNTSLFDTGYAALKAHGVGVVLNGSILSMLLLRSQSTMDFHPASPALRAAAQQVARRLHDTYGEELAELATRFAMREMHTRHAPTVLGVLSIPELDLALANHALVSQNNDAERDAEMVASVKQWFGPHWNETWSSGIPH